MIMRNYTCGMCGTVVEFYDGFKMVCKGWDRHAFNMGGEDDQVLPATV